MCSDKFARCAFSARVSRARQRELRSGCVVGFVQRERPQPTSPHSLAGSQSAASLAPASAAVPVTQQPTPAIVVLEEAEAEDARHFAAHASSRRPPVPSAVVALPMPERVPPVSNPAPFKHFVGEAWSHMPSGATLPQLMFTLPYGPAA